MYKHKDEQRRETMSQQLCKSVVSLHQRPICVVGCHFMPDKQYAGTFSMVQMVEGPPGELSPKT